MKQIVTGFICCLFMISTHAQPIKKNHLFYPEMSSIKAINSKKLKASNDVLMFSSKKGVFQSKTMKTIMQKMDSLIGVVYSTGKSEKVVKDEFFYNSSGWLTSYIEYEWDTLAANWISYFKAEFTYNAMGDFIQEIYYNWDEFNTQWVPSSKGDYSYNANGEVELLMAYYWETGSNLWILDFKEEYTYTSSTLISIQSSWNSSTSAWELGWKGDIQFDVYENPILEFAYHWDEDSVKWINVNKYEYTYNGGRLETKIESQEYAGVWEKFSKEQFTYTVSGDLITYTYFDWNSFTNQWEEYVKEEPDFNSQYGFNELIVPELFENNDAYFNHMLDSLLMYEYNGFSWDYLGGYLFYYSAINISGISEDQLSKIKVIPNANKQITITWNTNLPHLNLEVYSLNGQMVLDQVVGNNSSISLAHLREGLYLFRLSDSQEMKYVDKLIIQ